MSELEPSSTAFPSRLVSRASELKILMAEDNAVNQKLAMLLFKKVGLTPTIVATGVEAVKAAMGTTYDLIFMDVYMPEMDGLEATRILKDKLGEKCPYIIALTASAMNGDREKIMQAGVDEYFTKPMKLQILQDCLQRFVISE